MPRTKLPSPRSWTGASASWKFPHSSSERSTGIPAARCRRSRSVSPPMPEPAPESPRGSRRAPEGSAVTMVLSFVVVIGILILIHELGHFLVARWTGVGVERFSIGFGPVLARWRGKETEYALSLIPMGGYVKMMGEENPLEGGAAVPYDPSK